MLLPGRSISFGRRQTDVDLSRFEIDIANATPLGRYALQRETIHFAAAHYPRI
jgi:hypothetical protein